MNVKAVAFCAVVMMASPAAAEPWGAYGPGGYAPDVISPYHIQATLRANGLRPITRPVQSGPYIVVRAVDSFGDAVRVLLHARFGNIVSVTPLPPAPVLGERFYRPYGPYPYRPYGPYPRYGAVGPDVRPDLKVEPAPPPSFPNGQYNSVPNGQQHRSVVVTPGRPPMPRPRPATATAAVKPEAVEAPSAAPASPSGPTATETTGSVPEKPAGQSFPPAASLE